MKINLLDTGIKMKEHSGWQEFITNCRALTSNEDLSQFFELVLTPSEREKIAARYQILSQLVNDKLTQREIAAKIGVSIFNVTRGANQLKLVDDEVKSLLLRDEKCD